MPDSLTTAEARRLFSELVSRVRHTGARIVLTRYGRPVAALVSVEDLKELEEKDRPRKRNGGRVVNRV